SGSNTISASTISAITTNSNVVADNVNVTNTLYINGSAGTNGQVVTSSGGGAITWSTVSSSGGGAWTTSGTNVYRSSGNVGISNANPTHTLDVGSNVSVIDDGIDKLVIRGNCYVINDIISLGSIHTDILQAKDAFIKNTTVVAERPTRQVRLN
ncbi:hypothetical protein, partial [Bathycoccus sp. RCC716 virus 1]